VIHQLQCVVKTGALEEVVLPCIPVDSAKVRASSGKIVIILEIKWNTETRSYVNNSFAIATVYISYHA
jgi:hypothetical protein